ncbi:MAG: ECF-type riboflavin transporter substrate-binding protein [Schaedlerella sp.]|nr:ECF-type riboflavin transporter substrate-binding protein [Schaedlerella sp.]
MEKHLFDFNKKTVAAIIVGTIMFCILFIYVKIPSGIPETDIQTACGLGAFLGAIFGPVAGGMIAFIGHAAADIFRGDSPWWSWVIASGVSGFLSGMVYPKLRLEVKAFEKHDLVKFNLFQIVANTFAWLIVAPVLDILIYAESADLVFVQGLVAGVANIFSTAVIGAMLLVIYIEIKDRRKAI